MSAPIRVTMDELRDLWFSPEATALTIDAQRHVKAVRMTDGTVYEAPLDEATS